MSIVSIVCLCQHRGKKNKQIFFDREGKNWILLTNLTFLETIYKLKIQLPMNERYLLGIPLLHRDQQEESFPILHDSKYACVLSFCLYLVFFEISFLYTALDVLNHCTFQTILESIAIPLYLHLEYYYYKYVLACSASQLLFNGRKHEKRNKESA